MPVSFPLAAVNVAADTAEHAVSAHGSMNLIHDLGIVVAAAAFVAIVFQRLRWPVIFGYLLAGMMLGPNLIPYSPIQDLEGVRELSELGVILLLFFIGMEFDLGKLQRIIGPSLIALLLQTLAMLYLAKLFGPLLGWNALSALFFGSLLAISSSMVTIRVLREQGRMQLPHAQLAIGILIMEDVLAIVMLVILSGVAVTKQFDWDSIWLVTFLMGVFVVFVFFIGRLLAPRILKLLHDWDSHEHITVFSIGLVLGISVLAMQFEFSVALGAFLAGAILSQTKLVTRIEASNRSLHDLFSAVFFVTVGMLIDPYLILQNLGWVVLLSVLVILGKVLACWAGLFLAGQPSRSSFRAALAKSQIGEFSFIIAELGRSLEVTDERLSSVAFGVAFITILTTPLLTRNSAEVFHKITAKTPDRLLRLGGFYRQFFETVTSTLGHSMLLRLVKRPALQIAFYFFIVNGIILGASFAAGSIRGQDLELGQWYVIAVWLVAAVGVVPFLIAMLRNLNAIVFMLTEAVFAGQESRPVMQGRMRNVFTGIMLSVMVVLFGGAFLSAAANYLPRGSALGLFTGLILIVGIIFWRQMIRLNSHIENLFMESFTEDAHKLEERRREEVLNEISTRYPWPIDLCEHDVTPGAVVCGRAIRDLDLRESTGSSIIAVGRGGNVVFDPPPDTVLFAGDHVVLIGDKEQNRNACQMLDEQSVKPPSSTALTQFQVERILVPTGSPLDGNTLAGSELRKRLGVTVVGIQRKEERITAPRAETMMRAGDVLVVVGHRERLSAFTDAVAAHDTEASPSAS